MLPSDDYEHGARRFAILRQIHLWAHSNLDFTDLEAFADDLEAIAALPEIGRGPHFMERNH